MISVVIPTLNDGPRLIATFAALAPAAMDGFVREVIVADDGSSDETLEVAEDAGAEVVTTGFDDAIGQARQPWVLILTPGSRPQVGWEQAAHVHMRDYPGKAGWFDLALPGTAVGTRLAEGLARFESGVLGRLQAGHGLLAQHGLLATFMPVVSAEDLVRRLGRSRTRRIGARALLME